MGRFGLVLYVLMLLPLAVNAADVAGRQEFVLKHHEFQVSTGIVPGRYSFGYDHNGPPTGIL